MRRYPYASSVVARTSGVLHDQAMTDDDLKGRFWPDSPRRTDSAFDDVGTPFVLPARYPPTRAVLATAADRFGSRATPLLESWAGAWHAGVGDVDAWHAHAIPTATPVGDGVARSTLDNLAALSPDLAAGALFAAERRGLKGVQRDKAHHVMEEAVQTMALLDARVSFDLVFAPLSPLCAVVSGNGPAGCGLRHLDRAGNDAGQDRHAAAARRVRALHEADNPYWESPTFRSLAGRGMAVARGAPHLAAILRDMASSGHWRAFLKSTVTKAGTWVADLSGVRTLRDADMAAHKALGASYCLLAASDRSIGGILVQEFVPFTHEHRFLVVRNRVVASTASDRDLGVLDAVTHRILHPAVARLHAPAEGAGAYDRGDSDTLPDRDLVASFARTAREAARRLGREGMLPDCYCLDVGLTPRGVLPVEINTATRCGLYAADWTRFARALARRGERPAEAGRKMGGIPGNVGRDLIEEGVAFMLDILSDEPARKLREVGERLVGLAQHDPEAAAALGREHRANHEREMDEMPCIRPWEVPSWLAEDVARDLADGAAEAEGRRVETGSSQS